MSDSSFTSSLAGPSSPRPSAKTPPPPPTSIQRDDPEAVEQARQRFQKRGLLSNVSLPHILRRHPKAFRRKSTTFFPAFPEVTSPDSASSHGLDLVKLGDGFTASSETAPDKDVYRWAILYENQRGATVFSTPYYSSLTLLPLDPPPFTIPTPVRSPRKNQPTVSLEDYPLPDGSWKWVSRAWMIDMRGDGLVQYDGFEYARSFRSKQWGPNPGLFNNRGLVRRRRWIRLMMRPAQLAHEPSYDPDAPDGPLDPLPTLEHHEEGATRPPSVMLTVSDYSGGCEVWKGDDYDWERCHVALRRLGRDGRKLELWASWLGVFQSTPPSRPASWSPIIAPYVNPSTMPQSTSMPAGPSSLEDTISITTSRSGAEKLVEDSGASLAPAPRDSLKEVLRQHGPEVLTQFVYPDSRARFLLLLGRAGLLPEFQAGLSMSDSTHYLDFWSYTQSMDSDAISSHQSPAS